MAKRRTKSRNREIAYYDLVNAFTKPNYVDSRVLTYHLYTWWQRAKSWIHTFDVACEMIEFATCPYDLGRLVAYHPDNRFYELDFDTRMERRTPIHVIAEKFCGHPVQPNRWVSFWNPMTTCWTSRYRMRLVLNGVEEYTRKELEDANKEQLLHFETVFYYLGGKSADYLSVKNLARKMAYDWNSSIDYMKAQREPFEILGVGNIVDRLCVKTAWRQRCREHNRLMWWMAKNDHETDFWDRMPRAEAKRLAQQEHRRKAGWYAKRRDRLEKIREVQARRRERFWSYLHASKEERERLQKEEWEATLKRQKEAIEAEAARCVPNRYGERHERRARIRDAALVSPVTLQRKIRKKIEERSN